MSNIPKTLFNMRGNLLQLDSNIRKYWFEHNINKYFFTNNINKPTKLLIYGPPYANGELHTGHKINCILKDIYTHWWRGQGYNVSYLVGFDCHGRPIEYKINPSINANSDEKTIQHHIEQCRQLALKNIDKQYHQLQELNIFMQTIGDYKYYATLHEYVAIYEAFSHLLLNNYVYAQLRPMMWSLSDESVISEIETEYKTKLSTSVYVSLLIKNTNDHIVIWTTTPWTLIDNAAICYNKNLQYMAIKVENKRYIICKDLMDELVKKMQWQNYTTEKYDINEFVDIHHPVIDNKFVGLYHGNHVTNDVGTGFVHTAPAHGIEDFMIYQQYYNTRPFTFTESVGPNGHYYSHVQKLGNLHIFKDEIQIIETIKNKILFMEKYEHNYLFAQRSNEPVIYRASNQIFADLSLLNFEDLHNIYTNPASLRIGLYDYVKERKEWCLSRNRTWGVPLALVIHRESNTIYINNNFQKAIIEQMKINPYIFLYRSQFEKFASQYIENIHEYEIYLGVLDVWFDSACAYDIVTKLLNLQNYPSTFIEGVDQKRGWYQSSLLARKLQNKNLPYNEIISHGFVVDGNGRKLSKSLGNTQEVEQVISQYGNEILRIRMVECDYTTEIPLSKDIMESCAEKYRKIRNVLRYLISVCETYKLNTHVFIKDLPELESIYYYKLCQLMRQYTHNMSKYYFNEAFALLMNFIVEISSDYFNACKTDLYEKSDHENQHIIFLMNKILICLLYALRPILTVTTEEVFLHLKSCELSHMWTEIMNHVSIHLADIKLDDILNHDKLTITNDIINNYQNICDNIARELTKSNITTGYEKDYTMYIYNCGIDKNTLKRRFNLYNVTLINEHIIKFAK